ncbi:MAG: metallophosphoesterase [Clostridia bacterium]|nr:metallophosphoesterase [Clostridia bacterium]
MLSKLFAFFLSIYYMITPYVAPSTAEPIKVLDEQSVELAFVTWGDPQISNYLFEREPRFRAAAEDVANATSALDALLIVGDIAENGLQCEYDVVSDHLKGSGVKNYIMAVGNHDVRLRSYSQVVDRFTAFQNDLNADAQSELTINKLNYTYEINGYTFVVLGTDKTEFEESYISDEQLEWLDTTLKAEAVNGKPVFVILHQPLALTHGLPTTWGNGTNKKAGHVGAQSDALYEIMNKYSNIILITGHLHTGFGQYSYEKIGNIHGVNVPSTTIVNKDGDYNEPATGYVTEVYSDKVVFRARDFAKGEYVPDYDIEIALVK